MTLGKDIQVENGGYTRIHNEILMQLVGAGLGKYELACVLYVIRMTYGYQRKDAVISLGEFAEAMRVDKAHVSRAIKSLVDRNIVKTRHEGNGRGRKSYYGYNKYTETWDAEKVAESATIKGCGIRNNNDEKGCGIRNEKVAESATYTSGLKKEKKVVGERKETAPATAAESLAENPYVTAYEQTWGRLVESPYVSDTIRDWSDRVTIDAWRYALRESADANARNWKYLTRILERVERDGFVAPTPTQPAPVIDMTLEELYGHR